MTVKLKPVSVTTRSNDTLDGATFCGKAPRAKAVLLPGAGGSWQAEGLTFFAGLMATVGIDTLVINLPHNQQRRPPGAMAHSVAQLDALINTFAVADLPLIVGGKSYGSRVALTYAATTTRVAALIAYGFPLHALGTLKPRDTLLGAAAMPGLFVSGSRDPFGTAQQLHDALERYAGDATQITVVGGDHDCAIRKKYAPDLTAHAPTAALTQHTDAITGWLLAVCDLVCDA